LNSKHGDDTRRKLLGAPITAFFGWGGLGLPQLCSRRSSKLETRNLYNVPVTLSILTASTTEHFDIARLLFREYQASLNIDLCFQSFEEELAGLPGKYAAPRGSLLLAVTEDGTPAGVIAMRPIGDEICEMKRLYVRPIARGQNLGRRLIDRIFEQARSVGYKKMRLDTLTGLMDRAISLYREIGFYEIPAYYDSPLTNELFLEIDLTALSGERKSISVRS
jgi:GNAT superfamily N-acetyltransferase